MSDDPLFGLRVITDPYVPAGWFVLRNPDGSGVATGPDGKSMPLEAPPVFAPFIPLPPLQSNADYRLLDEALFGANGIPASLLSGSRGGSAAAARIHAEIRGTMFSTDPPLNPVWPRSLYPMWTDPSDPLRNWPRCACGNLTNRKRGGVPKCFDCEAR